MPVLSERQLLQEIKAKKCTVARLSKSSHYKAQYPQGKDIAWFAVQHPGNYVLAKYVGNVRKALTELS